MEHAGHVEPFGGRDEILAVCAGALLGAAIAYVCFTEPGRQGLVRASAALDGALERMRQIQEMVGRIREAIDEGRRTLSAIEHVVDPAPAGRAGSRRMA
jgi:type II secretory pathway component PulM